MRIFSVTQRDYTHLILDELDEYDSALNLMFVYPTTWSLDLA